MPDGDYDNDPDDQVDEGERQLKSLRDKADKASRLEAETATLRMENAILKAGLGDLSDKQVKALLAAHEGDQTADALKATATELGFTAAATEPPPAQQVPDEERKEHQQAAQATNGAEAAGSQVISVDDRIAAANSQEELDALLGLATLEGPNA